MSRYAEAHASPNGADDARPTALQIIKDEGAEGKLNGKVVVITGTSSGIGIETARALAATGATLFLTARDLTKARTALGDILDSPGATLFEMDQGSLASVRAAAAAILAKTDTVQILINNAGIMNVPDLQHTTDGHELQFGTNHLSHFLFFELLKPALLKAASPALAARVVNVSSASHNHGGLNADGDYAFANGGYDGGRAYAQSKTANIYMANEIERRYGADRHLHATSLSPGLIDTGISRFMPAAAIEAARQMDVVRLNLKSPAQGAATTVWAAVGAEWEHKGGKFLVDCGVARPSRGDEAPYAPTHAAHAYDAEKEARLWKDSLRLVGLPAEE
ncbi:hypothetical protein ACHAQA_000730 [Verticillium albo-atrum]